MKYQLQYCLALVLCMLLGSCKKFVEVPGPSTQVSASEVFSTDASAVASALAIYSQMETDGLPYLMIIHPGRSADEMFNYSPATADIEFYNNNLTGGNSQVKSLWQYYYKYIYQANAQLEGLSSSTQLSPSVQKQLQGEAYFIRAFCNFYLVNLFGGVPLVNSNSYEASAVQARNTVSECYGQIKDDLSKAVNLLSTDYLAVNNTVTPERTRPNQFAARALLARVYLYTGEWTKAETEASAVIANSQYTLLSDLNSVFLKNSREAIWQLQSQVPGYNTYPGAFLILTSTPTTAAIDSNFVNAMAAGDLRRSNWVKSITFSGKLYYYPFKYKVKQNASTITEYTMALRLSEQFLLRAEARASQNNAVGALADLNAIRSRAGLSSLVNLSVQSLLDSIAQERKWELLAEFGDRWINLNRTGTAGVVLTPIKGTNWTGTDVLYPIPLSEINLNGNLKQNPGY